MIRRVKPGTDSLEIVYEINDPVYVRFGDIFEWCTVLSEEKNTTVYLLPEQDSIKAVIPRRSNPDLLRTTPSSFGGGLSEIVDENIETPSKSVSKELRIIGPPITVASIASHFVRRVDGSEVWIRFAQIIKQGDSGGMGKIRHLTKEELK